MFNWISGSLEYVVVGAHTVSSSDLHFPSRMLLTPLAFLAAVYWCEAQLHMKVISVHHQVFCILLCQSCGLVLHVSFGLVKLHWIRTILLLLIAHCAVLQSTKGTHRFQDVNLSPLWGIRVRSPTRLSVLDGAIPSLLNTRLKPALSNWTSWVGPHLPPFYLRTNSIFQDTEFLEQRLKGN
jgi:hypothetical protein